MSALNFNGLKSYDGKVSEQDFNRLVDALQSITLNEGAGYQLRRNVVGTSIAIEPHPSQSGRFAHPYVMGSGASGSYANGFTDTWDRNNPPSGFTGVVWSGLRIYNLADSRTGEFQLYPSGSGHAPVSENTYRVFGRSLSFDSKGALVTISAEHTGIDISYVDFYGVGGGS